MSDRICERCRSTKVVVDGYYAGSTFYKCKNCQLTGIEGMFPKQTVFDYITQNIETLAEKMVFLKAVVCSFNAKDNTHYIEQWISTICNDVYPSKHEAFTATVEELKKEWKA